MVVIARMRMLAPVWRASVQGIRSQSCGSLVRLVSASPRFRGGYLPSWREPACPIAFADADQLCMCHPAPPGDPERERFKAQNVGALLPRYRAAGAYCVIVSGVLDPLRGVQPELMPQADVTVCRLRADTDAVVRRFTGRHGPGSDLEDMLQQSLREADAMDASDFGDVCVDTTDVGAAEVAALVRHSCRDWSGFSGSLPNDQHVAGADPAAGLKASDDAEGIDGNILLVCGPTGVGKSTVGFQLYVRCVRAGLTTGYVDLEQIGFVRPRPENDPGLHRLKAANLAAMWRTYHAAGATHLIATGPIESEPALQTYLQAFPAATVTVCRLHAGPVDLTQRIMSRGDGGSWPQPGDPLRGQPAEYLLRVADEAIAQDNVLERAGLAAARVDTGGRSVAEAADLIAGVITWPIGGHDE